MGLRVTRHVESEGGANTGLAEHRNSSPQLSSELVNDGQSQPRSPVPPPQTAIDLMELLEDQRERLRRDANAGV
jgi:hypothetical protein